MFTTARAPAEEIRRTLPKLQRLLSIFFALSLVSVVAQVALVRAADSGPTPLPAEESVASQDSPCTAVVGQNRSSLAEEGAAASPEAANSSVVALGPGNTVLSRGQPRTRSGLHIPGLVMALFGMSMSTHELHMRKRLLTFACFTFLNFAASAVLLLQKAEAPPGARHLLSVHCPVSSGDIAQFVRQQQQRFRKRLASGLPGRGDLLSPLDEAWPVTLPRGSTIDLCSPSWAVGNAYLIASGVLVLWMHAYAVRMLRSISSIPEDDGYYPQGLLGSAGRFVALHPDGGPESFGVMDPPHRTFVPFAGSPRKLLDS